MKQEKVSVALFLFQKLIFHIEITVQFVVVTGGAMEKRGRVFICIAVLIVIAVCIRIMSLVMQNTYRKMYPEAYAVSDEYHQVLLDGADIMRKEPHIYEDTGDSIEINGETCRRYRCPVCYFEKVVATHEN